MIWNSVALMTLVDVLVFAATAYCGWTLIQSFGAVRRLGYGGGVCLLFCGLLAAATFYSFDLVTMHVLPRYISTERAMAIMTELHLNWSWWVALVSVGALAVGFSRMMRKLLPATVSALQDLEHSRRELERALENKHRLELELRASHETLERRVGERTLELSATNRILAEEIVERRSAEDALSRSRAEFKAIFDSISDGVIYTGPESGLIQHTNPAALRLFGYPPEELRGQPVSVLLEAVENESADLENVVGEPSGYGSMVELCYRRKDRTTFVGETTASTIVDCDGHDRGRVFVVRDITQRREAQDTIRRLAYQDTLTNLVNRAEFERRLSRVISAARTQGTQHALLYLDLDQFKVVNDTCGHAAGDELLKQVSALLKRPVRQRDTVARLGGDEFGLLLENCPAGQAREVAERVRELLVGYRFQWQGSTFVAGASIGIVLIDGSSESKGELLRKADLACYTAKELGRNRVYEYREEDTELSKRHSEMQWVSRLNAAIDSNNFQLLRQTIMPLHNDAGAIPCYELLIRMRDDHNEFVAPGAFIPAAERFNMIGPIDRWVIREAFRYLAMQCWNARKGDGVPPLLFINLSGMSLNDNALPQYIEEQLHVNGIDGSNVCFEVTETAAVSNLEVAIERITSIKVLGCRFALDDFGSGLSSFSYFQALPVDYIKIDGNIVKRVLDDPMSCAIVESVQHVARAAGIETIAEHVENEALRAKLRAIGIDFAQGYGIDRPVPLELAPQSCPERLRHSV